MHYILFASNHVFCFLFLDPFTLYVVNLLHLVRNSQVIFSEASEHIRDHVFQIPQPHQDLRLFILSSFWVTSILGRFHVRFCFLK